MYIYIYIYIIYIYIYIIYIYILYTPSVGARFPSYIIYSATRVHPKGDERIRRADAGEKRDGEDSDFRFSGIEQPGGEAGPPVVPGHLSHPGIGLSDPKGIRQILQAPT